MSYKFVVCVLKRPKPNFPIESIRTRLLLLSLLISVSVPYLTLDAYPYEPIGHRNVYKQRAVRSVCSTLRTRSGWCSRFGARRYGHTRRSGTTRLRML